MGTNSSRETAVQTSSNLRRLAGRVALMSLGLGSVACSNKPPPDFAPDPGLVARISEIRMHVMDGRVCPGNTVRATYDAVLNDGSVIPFETRYDDDHPPALHMVFLGRHSGEARPRNDGGWDTYDDPLLTAMTGFRLNAFLRANPSLSVERTIEPDYSCMRHAFSFRGPNGSRGQIGQPGPDITVRLNVLSSPFYEELLVAGVEVGHAPPFYIFADYRFTAPADWIIVESVGGPGGRGVSGADGAAGSKGTDGCPAGNGGAGGAGGNGGPGGSGGSGGHISIVVPDDMPLLAGMVEGHSSNGPGGKGGPPGKGGAGGEGGLGVAGETRCTNGTAGANGADGSAGVDGPQGQPGPRPQVLTVPWDQVFRDPRIIRLVEYHLENQR